MKKILMAILVLGSASSFANETEKKCSISINLSQSDVHAQAYADALESYAREKGYSEVSRNFIPEAHRIGFELGAFDRVFNRGLSAAEVNIDLIPVAPDFDEYDAYFLRLNSEEIIRTGCKQKVRNHRNDQGQIVEETGLNIDYCVNMMIKSAKRLIPKCN